jgi:hypothetical protein
MLASDTAAVLPPNQDSANEQTLLRRGESTHEHGAEDFIRRLSQLAESNIKRPKRMTESFVEHVAVRIPGSYQHKTLT